MEKLNYKFGDDGVFYISFEDMLKRFDMLDRVRLFSGDDWYNSQLWTSVNVPWMATYLDNVKFVVDVTEPGVVVFVLSQVSLVFFKSSNFLQIHIANGYYGKKLDDRYYQGLKGQYTYKLHFLLREAGSDDSIALAGSELATRSVSAELELEPGKYEVIPKLVAYRDKDEDLVEEAVKNAAESNPQKLQQVGLNYDRAHLKASQWKPNQEATKNEKSIPIRESKAPEQTTVVKVVVKQDSSTVAPTEGSAAAESGVPGTAQPDTAKEDEAKREQPSGSPAVVKVASGQDEQQPDATAGAGSEDDKNPDSAEEKPKAEEEEGDEDKPAGPWNAVCVVGLRVYSKDANLELHLEDS